ncbi:MAG: hypothetical protein LBC58_05800 [Clostridiales Family XIII bacterium]|jgi:hypothetical protein|nr:hypothetical protein [Clostridiales Family XIII bacterium]
MTSNQKERKKRTPVFWLILVALLLAIEAFILLGLPKLLNDDNAPIAGDFVIDADAGTDTDIPQNIGGASQGIQIPGYPEIPVAADSRELRVALLNPEGNPCYFKFEIVLEGSDETLYESDWVPPGESVSRQALKHSLPKGQHKAIIRIATASLDDSHSPMNGAEVATTLVAQ